MYLDRIAAYDKKGPALNAILRINPNALELADEMDKQFARSGSIGPLHCIPTILKENFDTADMPTTAASAALDGLIPPADGYLVKKLKAAGALILAKANMHELARAGVTMSSLGGQTLNPYDLTRTPGGSSGGTGAGIAANFATIGTGSDTVNSIRSPASANDVVGFRPTGGLLSRAGIVPVSITQDCAGPITRTVTDTARMLDVMVGYDPGDPLTAWSIGRVPATYTAFLDSGGLRGARIGVLRTLFGTGPLHAEVNQVMARAIGIMQEQGATMVEVSEPSLDAGKLNHDGDVQKWEFRPGLNEYLAGMGSKAPVKSLAELIASGRFHKPSLESFLVSAQTLEKPLEDPEYKNRLLLHRKIQQTVMSLMADHRLDALVYPLQKRLVVPAGEMDQADRNGILAALTGLPALDVPAGFSPPSATAPDGVPIGMDFLGRPWSEPTLLRLAFAFEQASRVRRPPALFPPLSGN
jgi:Asp-tRNA(Asn)/Glu-tRNA(Gln) amidotransferase A subunit family amidase